MVVAFGSGSGPGLGNAFGPAQAVKAQRVAPVARSMAALMLACGARPEEMDGVVQTLIEMEHAGIPVPKTYEEIVSQTTQAIEAYRGAMADVVEAADPADLPSENG